MSRVVHEELRKACKQTTKALARLIDDALVLSKEMNTLRLKVDLISKAAAPKAAAPKAAAPKAAAPKAAAPKAPVADLAVPKAQFTVKPGSVQPAPTAKQHFMVCRRVKTDPTTKLTIGNVTDYDDWGSMVLIESPANGAVTPSMLMFISKVMRESAENAAAGLECVYVYRVSIPKNSVVPYKDHEFRAGEPLRAVAQKLSSVKVRTARLMKGETAVELISVETLRSFVESNADRVESFLSKFGFLSSKPHASAGKDVFTRRLIAGILRYSVAANKKINVGK